MRRQHFVRTTGIALAATLALSLTGCGSDDGDQDTAWKPSSGPSASSGASKAPAGGDETPAASSEPGGTSTEAAQKKSSSDDLSGDELAALLSKSMKNGGTAVISMTSSQAEASTTTSGVVDYRTNPPSMSLTSKVAALGGVESRIILVDNAMYMDMGEMSQGKFLKMPLGEEASQMLDLSQLDPASAFKDMYGGLQGVKSRGEEKLKAGTFRRYDAEVSTEKITKELPKAALQDFPKTAKYSFWFDDDDMVRQVVVDLGKTGTTTMNYDDWGTKVTIKAPKASEVTEMPSMPEMPAEPNG